jgi:formylglycine-generating enzyme required for sulfatase activity
MREHISDNITQPETELWPSLSTTKSSAGTLGNFVDSFAQQIILEPAEQVLCNHFFFINSIGMEFILISAGSFMMGSDKLKDKNADNIEIPQHRVNISQRFYLGRYAVTQAQWTAVMENNPSRFKGRSNPVEMVSWDDAQDFIRRLNRQEGHNRCRLPTEAEWEYAARAGTTSVYSFGDDAADLGRYAWYYVNSSKTTQPVGLKEPNAWGLYDMYGNVWEWVQDRLGINYYRKSPLSDPRGPLSGVYRAARGGDWCAVEMSCRSAGRGGTLPGTRFDGLGFRLALSPVEQQDGATGAASATERERTVDHCG